MTQDEFKASIVQMILATDMVCHFSLKENILILHGIIRKSHQKLARLKKRALSAIHLPHNGLKSLFPTSSQDPFLHFKQNYFIPTAAASQEHDTSAALPQHVLNRQERLMMCQILVHAADISNPCRPWPVFHQLSSLVCIEFFRQGEQERALGLPVSPNMNQQEANVSAINVGFIDFIVQPYFEALAVLYPKAKELVAVCTRNRDEWINKASTTDALDALGNNITSVNVALGGPIQPHVTTAAGTVIIPEHVFLKGQKKINNGVLPLNRSVSFNHLPSRVLPIMEEEEQEEAHIRKYRNQRRKSADTTMRQVHTKHRSFIASARRKSEELSHTINLFNQPKMVSFSDR
jgi:hypothetical protein